MSLCILRKVEGIKEWNIRGDHDVHCAKKIMTLEIIKTLFTFWGRKLFAESRFLQVGGGILESIPTPPSKFRDEFFCGDCYNISDNKN